MSKMRKGPIHHFLIHFTLETIRNGKILDISYEAYHELQRVKHPVFSKITSWDQFNVLIHYLDNYSELVPEKIGKRFIVYGSTLYHLLMHFQLCPNYIFLS